MRKFAWVCTLLFLLASNVLAQDSITLVINLAPFKTEQDHKIEKDIINGLKNRLSVLQATSFKQALEILYQTKNAVLTTVFYQRIGKRLNLYGQIYHSQEHYVIDAIAIENLEIELSDLDLANEEIAESDKEIIRKMQRKLLLRIRANPRQIVKDENIEIYLKSTPVAKARQFTYRQKTTEASEVFKVLQEQNEITIVTKRIGKTEKLARTPATASVVGRQEIVLAGARNLTDILKLLPGIEISYDQFGFFKVAFRGIRSKSGVLLLLDGHRINNFYDGSTFLDIRADLIEKVEVIRGPGSALHGNNAFVGVINVLTRKKAKGTELNAMAGNFYTLESSGLHSRSMANFKVTAMAHLYQSERQRRHLEHDDSCTPADDKNNLCQKSIVALSDNFEITTNDFKKQINALFSIEHIDTWYLDSKLLHENRGPNVGELTQLTPNSEIKTYFYLLDLGRRELTISRKLKFSGKIYSDFIFRRDDIEVERADLVDHAGISARKRISYDYQTGGVEIIGQYSFHKELDVMLGLQGEFLRLSRFDIEQNFQGVDFNNLFTVFKDYDNLEKKQVATRRILAVFTQTIWDIFFNLSLTIGLRYENYSDFGDEINPKAAIVYTIFSSKKYGELITRGLYGTAFRAPTFRELYDQTQQFQSAGLFGNPDLQPERIQTFEVGFEYRTRYRPLSLLGSAFLNKIDNNIEGNNLSGTIPSANDTFQNLRGIQIIGGEGEMRLRFGKRNYGFANVSWFRAQDFGGFSPFEDQDVKTYRLDIPQLRLNVGAFVALGRYLNLYNSLAYSSTRSANYRFVFEASVGRRFDLPAYVVWNTGLSTTDALEKNLFISFHIFNILDQDTFDDANNSEDAFDNRSFATEGRFFQVRVRYEI